MKTKKVGGNQVK